MIYFLVAIMPALRWQPTVCSYLTNTENLILQDSFVVEPAPFVWRCLREPQLFPIINLGSTKFLWNLPFLFPYICCLMHSSAWASKKNQSAQTIILSIAPESHLVTPSLPHKRQKTFPDRDLHICYAHQQPFSNWQERTY